MQEQNYNVKTRGIEELFGNLGKQTTATLEDVAATSQATRKFVGKAEPVIDSIEDAAKEAATTFRDARVTLSKINTILPDIRSDIYYTNASIQELTLQGNKTLKSLQETLFAVKVAFVVSAIALALLIWKFYTKKQTT
jgi:trans-aconitate methyltransferase